MTSTLGILWQFLMSKVKKKSEKHIKVIQKDCFNLKMELSGEVKQKSNLLKECQIKNYKRVSNNRTVLGKWKVYNIRIRHVEFQVKSIRWQESIK